MLATFLMPFHSYRIDNVLQSIRFLERNHPDVVAESELILLCQDRIGVIRSGFASTRTINLRMPSMQKCQALNQGVQLSAADKLVCLDSDRILPSGYFRNVLDNLESKTVVTTQITHKLRWMVPDSHIIDNRLTVDVQPRIRTGAYGMTAFSGNATLHKEDYWRAGGMDESYIGYGFEDNDMSNRLQRAGVRAIFRDEIEIHLYHRPDSYGPPDQKRLFLENGLRYCRTWKVEPPQELLDEIAAYTGKML